MKYLLDSHILIWALTDYEELPERVMEIIADERNEIYYSLASLWEVTIKHINKPEYIPISGADVSYGCRQLGYNFLSIQEKHVSDLENLKKRSGAPKHADPVFLLRAVFSVNISCLIVIHGFLLMGRR